MRYYERLRRIGQGGMGELFEGRMQLALGRMMPCAIKLIREDVSDDPRMKELFGREAITSIELNHPNLVRAHDFGVADNGRLFLILELIEGPNLSQVRGMLDDDPYPALRRIARDVTRAMHYLHRQNIVHRDITPRNIMLDRLGDVKLGDLGIVKRATGTGPFDAPGVPDYTSPECLRGETASSAADMYALGAALFFMITGEPPLGHDPDPWAPHDGPRPLPDEVPDDFAQLVHDLLSAEPEKRPNAETVLARLDDQQLATDDQMRQLANAGIETDAEDSAREQLATPLGMKGALIQLESSENEVAEQAPPRQANVRRWRWTRWFLTVVVAVIFGATLGALAQRQSTSGDSSEASVETDEDISGEIEDTTTSLATDDPGPTPARHEQPRSRNEANERPPRQRGSEWSASNSWL